MLVALVPAFPEEDEIYAYAIGVLVGTVIQLLIPAWDLRNTPYGLRRALVAPFRFGRGDWRDSRVRRVLVLMLPVTISLGLINFNLLINSTVGFLVSDQVPAAIDKAFRIYMLPQGIFSVAIATVLFPTLARFAARSDHDGLRATMANGMRQILLLLVPATAAILVLSEPMTRLVYERGVFDAISTDLVSEALFWFAFSLPFNGLFLLMTRTFFSLQRPWLPTAISRREPGDHGGRRAAPLRAVRGRRHRRRDGDRDDRERRRPGLGPAGQLGRLELGRLFSSGAAHRARGRRPGRRLVRCLGRARRRVGPRGGRADRLARRRRSAPAPSHTSPRSSRLASPRRRRPCGSCVAR